MVMRSTSNSWVPPDGSWTGPSLRRISSNAVGQSSSVPSSNPIGCLVAVAVKAASLRCPVLTVHRSLGHGAWSARALTIAL